MSQHDMDVANGPGLTFRTDMNAALQALASQSSGASAPSTTFPCQLWADTGTGRLKQRNAANSAWLDRGPIDSAGDLPLSGGTMTGPINDAPTQTIASAATTDIGAATSNVVAISGTTTITGLGTIAAGARRTVRFLGALVLTHNAASLILPAGANITTAANDVAEFLSLGSGNWFCLRYTPASGLAVSPGGKNLFLNPVGAVNQRGYVSGTATTVANQFTVDRMKVVVSGQSLTLTASGIGFVMTAPAGGVEQVIEGNTIEGGVYTLSWTGTAIATVNGTAISNKGQTGSLTAGTNVTIRFTGGTYTAVQFELGAIATPFDKRPFAAELSLCQRYARKWVANGESGVSNGGGGDFGVKHPVVMRAAPTFTLLSIGIFVDGVASGTPTSITMVNAGADGCWMGYGTGGATTAGRGCVHRDHTGIFSADL
ncbi:hypothetical protein JQF37_02085 [Pseudomonas sp. MIL9]|uniref:hypothetical protein n=1 Tax=Pseudomonas sp. MIL9 TaxID=2807620 RepID=UPI00194FB01B|nr:hypothetical protein [Pseudomonas sp. MIL9]MBM6442416.1 hypothetical protein [Pseudomonas sp. MIL9]